MHAFWLVLTYDLLEDRRIDDVIVKTFFPYILILYFIKQIDSNLPCICSVTSVTHSAAPRVPLFCSYHILTSSVISTQRSGKTLDLIITRDLDGFVQTTPISDSFLSEHCIVLSELALCMPATTVKEVCYRNTKAIDIESFKDDLRKSRLCQDPPDALTDLVSCYGSTMTSLLDKHAPLQKKTITVRRQVPSFNNEIKEAKRLRRQGERIWRRTGLESDRVKFIKARNRTNHAMEQARREYYFNLINENDCDQSRVFQDGQCTARRVVTGTIPQTLWPYFAC